MAHAWLHAVLASVLPLLPLIFDSGPLKQLEWRQPIPHTRPQRLLPQYLQPPNNSDFPIRDGEFLYTLNDSFVPSWLEDAMTKPLSHFPVLEGLADLLGATSPLLLLLVITLGFFVAAVVILSLTDPSVSLSPRLKPSFPPVRQVQATAIVEPRVLQQSEHSPQSHLRQDYALSPCRNVPLQQIQGSLEQQERLLCTNPGPALPQLDSVPSTSVETEQVATLPVVSPSLEISNVPDTSLDNSTCWYTPPASPQLSSIPPRPLAPDDNATDGVLHPTLTLTCRSEGDLAASLSIPPHTSSHPTYIPTTPSSSESIHRVSLVRTSPIPPDASSNATTATIEGSHVPDRSTFSDRDLPCYVPISSPSPVQAYSMRQREVSELSDLTEYTEPSDHSVTGTPRAIWFSSIRGGLANLDSNGLTLRLQDVFDATTASSSPEIALSANDYPFNTLRTGLQRSTLSTPDRNGANLSNPWASENDSGWTVLDVSSIAEGHRSLSVSASSIGSTGDACLAPVMAAISLPAVRPDDAMSISESQSGSLVVTRTSSDMLEEPACSGSSSPTMARELSILRGQEVQCSPELQDGATSPQASTSALQVDATTAPRAASGHARRPPKVCI